MSEKLLFYYFGDDEAYFRALQGEFKSHGKLVIDFKRIYQKTEIEIQSLFLNVFKDKPDCVFIDFSKETQDYLHLARLISRTPLEHQIVMVGLVDYLSPPEILTESIATGVHLNFIKSVETFDVAFSVTRLLAPQSAAEHGFANASLKEDYETGILCKIGYIHSDGIHIETDYNLSKGDRVSLKHHWLEKKIVPSKQVFVKETATTNMFYQFKNNADLDFLFIDDFLPPEGMIEEDVKVKQGERDELVVYHKKQLSRWLEKNRSDSLEKKAKILVVDYKFHFYQDQTRTDKHPYTIRCIPFFNDISVELNRLQPQVIAFEIDKDEGAKNTVEALKKLVSSLFSAFPELKPYIIVFNSEMTSQELQSTIQYPQTLAHEEELSPDLLIRMADVLQKKITEKSKVPSDPSTVFIRKSHPSSVAEILKSVTVIKLSETDLVIQSEFSFTPGTNLHFTEPVEMFVNIQPALKPSGKLPEFYGVIHSMGESEKKELRRYIQSVFFRDHDAQQSAEANEYKKLNELKLQEKIQKAQKEKEEAEALVAKNAEIVPEPRKHTEIENSSEAVASEETEVPAEPLETSETQTVNDPEST